MSDARPAHERELRIEWQILAFGVRRGRIDGGWLYIKETPGGQVAMCHVPDPEPVEFIAVEERDRALTDAQVEGLIEAISENRLGLTDLMRRSLGLAPIHDSATCDVCQKKTVSDGA